MLSVVTGVILTTIIHCPDKPGKANINIEDLNDTDNKQPIVNNKITIEHLKQDNEHIFKDTKHTDRHNQPRVKSKHIYESFDIKADHVSSRRVFHAIYTVTIVNIT